MQQNGPAIYLNLPPVLRAHMKSRLEKRLDIYADFGVEGFLVHTWDQAAWLRQRLPQMRLQADASLYTYNGSAAETMAEAGTVWVPTLSTVGNLRGKGRFRESAVQAILEGAMENVAAFGKMGGRIAPGTDAGAWAVPHGSETEEPLLRLALLSRTDAILQAGSAVIQQKF